MRDDERLLDYLRPLLLSDQDFYAIRGQKRLRWIVPAETQRVRSVFSSWRPYGVKSQIAWTGLRWVLSLAPVLRLPLEYLGRGLGGAADSQIEAWAGGRSLVPIVYVGTEGPTQKLVCQYTEADGSVAAVARIPVGAAAAQGITNDIQALSNLADTPIAPHIPRLLLGSASSVGLQSALPGIPSGRRFGLQHTEVLLKLPRTGRSELRSRADSLALEVRSLGNTLPQFVDDVQRWAECIPHNMIVPTVWQHGDFVPWNIRQHDGVLHVLDWEDAAPDGLPLWDIAHFHIQQAFLLKKPGNVLAAIDQFAGSERYRKCFALHPTMMRHLTRFYCVEQGLKLWTCEQKTHAMYLFSLFSRGKD